jgi:hypothetical protein
MKTDAKFSACRKYRYALWRNWDGSKPYAMIIGLNPSTADENENDPTITRCINFAKSWGYGGVCVTNLFAYCASFSAPIGSLDAFMSFGTVAWLYKLAREA